ncbi:MAG: Co2+/Mg2+ efflux protein ApaG [Comamonas sp. SCN 65-56]|uniref:Co2+/Mg2+ efflux protein ApaG n=1 Tax=Comamonas sp. SCN 65-56 TaxID=1660095 RepID=UPI00086DBC53|nr:Co2+/Mg2+ efflux protein ApaG [Comamonas sp. SCN 65-56]ODS90721.1 MAG: Co2+/Mg2+ efflux protein ApaG [Comamonas sp. SCN 65-56]
MPKYAFHAEAQPHYLPEHSSPERGIYSFAYTITITNVGEMAAQLIARHWIIRDAGGGVQEVKGLGVVGQQPLLAPGEAFEYTSGCRLRTASGSMHGSYFCVAEDGERFDCAIAPFALQAIADDGESAHDARVLH